MWFDGDGPKPGKKGFKLHGVRKQPFRFKHTGCANSALVVSTKLLPTIYPFPVTKSLLPFRSTLSPVFNRGLHGYPIGIP